MNIIIVGAGTVGYSLAEHLCAKGHHITVIEKDPSLCDHIASKLDVNAIPGIGSSPAALYEAGIKKAEMIIAVTPSDEVNILTCNFAMQNGVPKRIARVKSNLYTQQPSCIDLGTLGVTSVIEPEWEVVNTIKQYVELPNVLETANFQNGSICLRGYKITENMPLAHKTLAEIKTLAPAIPMLVVAITREGKSISPTGDQTILPEDNIVVIMPKESFKTFCTLVNAKPAKHKKLIISGDSLTAIHLAQALKSLCERIILIDPDLEHGRYAASLLDGIEIIHGDTTNCDLLQEICIEHADYFIAAGHDSEDNIMSCLLAKSEGAPRTIAVKDSSQYNELFHSLGIDHVILPQEITLNTILEKIQAASLGVYLKLKTNDTAIVRFTAARNSAVVDASLRQLNDLFKKTVTLGAIIRGDHIIIPEGNTVIREGDEAMILCQKKHIATVNKWFSPQSIGAQILKKPQSLIKKRGG